MLAVLQCSRRGRSGRGKDNESRNVSEWSVNGVEIEIETTTVIVIVIGSGNQSGSISRTPPMYHLIRTPTIAIDV
jgi:hypothetical protein